MSEDSQPQTNPEKENAFYSATVQGWIATRMERDKSLLTLSAAGIGLLVTLLTSVGAASWLLAAICSVAIVSFICCLITAIQIFGRNADYLEKVVHGTQARDPLLAKLDRWLHRCFIVGIVFTVLFGLLAACTRLAKPEEGRMTDDKRRDPTKKSSRFVGSFDGLSNLSPSAAAPGDAAERSLDGLSNLKPTDPKEPQTTPASADGTDPAASPDPAPPAESPSDSSGPEDPGAATDP